MKKTLIALTIFAATFTSCLTDEDGAKRILKNEGYTEVVFTGYDAWSCGEEDTYSTGFVATNKNGVRVEGVICSGILKGYTIRFK